MKLKHDQLLSNIAFNCNLRHYSTGEKNDGKHTFKGARFYRVLDKFIDQSGVYVDSVFGGMFADDPGGLLLRHDRKGLLSTANSGPNTNTGGASQSFILTIVYPHNRLSSSA